jgi:hypothetical protein
MRLEVSMRHMTRERLTRNVVGAMLAIVLATGALFGVARHFAG